jgi:hypothetical protein
MEQTAKRLIIDKHLAKRTKQAKRIAHAKTLLKAKYGQP